MLNPNEAIKQLSRTEEDAEISAKSHYNAAAKWDHLHIWLGVLLAILFSILGFPLETEFSLIKNILSIVYLTIFGAFYFLKPSGRSASHKSVADDYLALRNHRIFNPKFACL